MSDKVILIETLNRLQQFNLPHEQYCEAVGECSCSKVTHKKPVIEKRTGQRFTRPVEMTAPASITLLPRGKSDPLPRAVLDCPEVAAALKEKPRRLAWKPASTA